MEIWKDIPGYKGRYQVSNEGRVKSLCYYGFPGKIGILKSTDGINGYPKVSLKGKFYMVHQLVAMSFLGHKPNRHNEVVDHINNNPKDNRLENLQIITQRENVVKSKKPRELPTGVTKNVKGSRYHAVTGIKNKRIHLGSFDTPEEAHEAYLTKLKEIEDND